LLVSRKEQIIRNQTAKGQIEAKESGGKSAGNEPKVKNPAFCSIAQNPKYYQN
jgi:hypothetical protein